MAQGREEEEERHSEVLQNHQRVPPRTDLDFFALRTPRILVLAGSRDGSDSCARVCGRLDRRQGETT